MGGLNISLHELGTTGLAVVLILALLSIWSLTVAGERLLVLSRARKQSRAFSRVATKYLTKGEVQAVLDAAGRFPHSHLAAVVCAGLSTFQQKRAKTGLPPSEVLVATGRSLDRAARLASDDLRRGLGALATIASTAPFVGLFGTVVGIIHAFESIGAAGGGGFATVSQGIAEALWTTALGLVVAVPAVWMFNFLTQRIQRLQEEIESSASELLDFVADPS